jgi:GDP-L-fucose synthase
MALPDAAFDALLGDDGLGAGPLNPPLINIGYGEDQRIAELAGRIAAVVGYQGRLSFDRSKPDGTPRKWLDIGKLAAAHHAR